MKIVVVGAGATTGRLVVEETLDAGHVSVAVSAIECSSRWDQDHAVPTAARSSRQAEPINAVYPSSIRDVPEIGRDLAHGASVVLDPPSTTTPSARGGKG